MVMMTFFWALSIPMARLLWQKGYHQGLYLCEGIGEIHAMEGGRGVSHGSHRSHG